MLSSVDIVVPAALRNLYIAYSSVQPHTSALPGDSLAFSDKCLTGLFEFHVISIVCQREIYYRSQSSVSRRNFDENAMEVQKVIKLTLDQCQQVVNYRYQ